MKKIEIITRPFKLDEVKSALTDLGIQGMTVTDVRGLRAASAATARSTAERKYQVDFVPKVKIEIVVADSMADEVVRVVTDAARTNQIGDGKIFVSPVEEVVRIRTGETGDEAI